MSHELAAVRSKLPIKIRNRSWVLLLSQLTSTNMKIIWNWEMKHVAESYTNTKLSWTTNYLPCNSLDRDYSPSCTSSGSIIATVFSLSLISISLSVKEEFCLQDIALINSRKLDCLQDIALINSRKLDYLPKRKK